MCWDGRLKGSVLKQAAEPMALDSNELVSSSLFVRTGSYDIF